MKILIIDNYSVIQQYQEEYLNRFPTLIEFNSNVNSDYAVKLSGFKYIFMHGHSSGYGKIIKFSKSHNIHFATITGGKADVQKKTYCRASFYKNLEFALEKLQGQMGNGSAEIDFDILAYGKNALFEKILTLKDTLCTKILNDSKLNFNNVKDDLEKLLNLIEYKADRDQIYKFKDSKEIFVKRLNRTIDKYVEDKV